MVSSSTRAAAVVLAVITVNSVSGKGQSPAIQPGAAANREYAAVFAHSDDPCSANAATAPYVECMGNELRFVEAHLDAFVEGLRGISGSPEELAGPSLLRDLAEPTGGRHFFTNLHDLPDIAEKIGIELRNEYLIGYSPSNGARDGKYRKITVKVIQPPGLPKLRSYWRKGYVAPTQ